VEPLLCEQQFIATPGQILNPAQMRKTCKGKRVTEQSMLLLIEQKHAKICQAIGLDGAGIGENG
jgi:hypothetical protein